MSLLTAKLATPSAVPLVAIAAALFVATLTVALVRFRERARVRRAEREERIAVSRDCLEQAERLRAEAARRPEQATKLLAQADEQERRARTMRR